MEVEREEKGCYLRIETSFKNKFKTFSPTLGVGVRRVFTATSFPFQRALATSPNVPEEIFSSISSCSEGTCHASL